MSRTVVLDWNAFMNGEVKKIHPKQVAGIVVKSLVGNAVFFIPTKAFAITSGATASATASAVSWGKIFAALLAIADWASLGIIFFAGGVWMFGNRTKALEALLNAAIGYIIIRHAQDIQKWWRLI